MKLPPIEPDRIAADGTVQRLCRLCHAWRDLSVWFEDYGTKRGRLLQRRQCIECRNDLHALVYVPRYRAKRARAA